MKWNGEIEIINKVKKTLNKVYPLRGIKMRFVVNMGKY